MRYTEFIEFNIKVSNISRKTLTVSGNNWKQENTINAVLVIFITNNAMQS